MVLIEECMLDHCYVICSSVIGCGGEEPASVWLPTSRKETCCCSRCRSPCGDPGLCPGRPSGRGRGRSTVAPAIFPNDPEERTFPLCCSRAPCPCLHPISPLMALQSPRTDSSVCLSFPAPPSRCRNRAPDIWGCPQGPLLSSTLPRLKKQSSLCLLESRQLCGR